MKHRWTVGERAIYVAGPPCWASPGDVVTVVHVGHTKDGIQCATIERIDGKRCAITADERDTNIRKSGSK